jgi:hypothetical protein
MHLFLFGIFHYNGKVNMAVRELFGMQDPEFPATEF